MRSGRAVGNDIDPVVVNKGFPSQFSGQMNPATIFLQRTKYNMEKFA